jgi:hypothetical protein
MKYFYIAIVIMHLFLTLALPVPIEYQKHEYSTMSSTTTLAFNKRIICLCIITAHHITSANKKVSEGSLQDL